MRAARILIPAALFALLVGLVVQGRIEVRELRAELESIRAEVSGVREFALRLNTRAMAGQVDAARVMQEGANADRLVADRLLALERRVVRLERRR